MFRYLEAEQVRNGFTDSDVATILGISRVSYYNKKRSGKFTTIEIKTLCKTFKDYMDITVAMPPSALYMV